MAQKFPIARQSTTLGLSFLDDIIIQNGPKDIMGRFFLLVDMILRERGLRFENCQFDELLAINQANRASWLPLTPSFDVRVSDLTPDNSFCFIGRNSAGEIVTTQAGRIFDWHDSSFKNEAESLRIFYADPKYSRQPGEHCWVSAPSAAAISGKVLYTGGMWYRPDYRSAGLAYHLGRLARAYALSQWDIDYASSLMTAKIVAAGTASRFGHSLIADGVHSRNSTLGDLDYVIGYSQGPDISGQIAEFLAAHDNTFVDETHGQQSTFRSSIA
jgi:hypothetical protein